MSQTTYHYDQDGRLVGATTVAAPEWSEEDLAYALAWQDLQSDIHPPCGHRLSVTTDPANRDTHEVVQRHRCDACQAVEDYVEERRDNGQTVSRADMYVTELNPDRRLEVRLQ